MTAQNRYSAILEEIFFAKYKEGDKEVSFERPEIIRFSDKLGIEIPKNLGDLVYSFRYRTPLPDRIRKTAPQGNIWIIRPAGRSLYRFALVPDVSLGPNPNMVETKILEATPGIVARYALTDEQALLAKVRYNRLIDVFTGVTCYSLQNHLRTTAPEMGQVEIDEIYVGVDKRGAQYVFPIQAKGGTDKLNIVQIEQDIGVCDHKFPDLICRPIGTQFMKDGVIALIELEQGDRGVRIVGERHYRLVPPEEVTREDLRNYRERLLE